MEGNGVPRPIRNIALYGHQNCEISFKIPILVYILCMIPFPWVWSEPVTMTGYVYGVSEREGGKCTRNNFEEEITEHFQNWGRQ